MDFFMLWYITYKKSSSWGLSGQVLTWAWSKCLIEIHLCCILTKLNSCLYQFRRNVISSWAIHPVFINVVQRWPHAPSKRVLFISSFIRLIFIKTKPIILSITTRAWCFCIICHSWIWIFPPWNQNCLLSLANFIWYSVVPRPWIS